MAAYAQVRPLRPSREAEALRRVLAHALNPPGWATHSVVEDGGVTHERVSDVKPQATAWTDGDGSPSGPATEVSLSVADRPTRHGWTRTAPRVQVAGGTFTITQARRLQKALDELLSVVDHA